MENTETKTYKIKKLTFKDIKVVATTLKRLELDGPKLEEIFRAITNGAGITPMTNLADIEKYITETEGKERFQELMELYNQDVKGLTQYIVKKQTLEDGRMSGILSTIYEVVGMVGDKFDILVEFISYLIIDMEEKDLLEMDIDEAVTLIKAIFTSAEMKRFFSSFFKQR